MKSLGLEEMREFDEFDWGEAIGTFFKEFYGYGRG